jgi:hypothetical protein
MHGTGKFNALDLVDTKLLLEEHLGVEVDACRQNNSDNKVDGDEPAKPPS